MKTMLLAAAAVCSVASAAQAADTTIVVGPGVQAVGFGTGTTVAADRIEERGNGTGYTVVSDLAPRSGTGSLEIHGDRSRYVIGSIYGNALNGLGSLADLGSINFDYRTDATTAAQLHAQPVVRLHVFDNATSVRSEITWEGVYNGGSVGVTPTLGQFETSTDGLFYVNVRSNGANFLAAHPGYTLADGTSGIVYQNGGFYADQLSDLQSLFSSTTTISGISFGAGSSFGAGFTGFIDNVTLNFAGGSTTYNFETAAGAVPEPASWAMMISGFGLVGGAMRRRIRVLATA